MAYPVAADVAPHDRASLRSGRNRAYLWLCLSASVVTFTGFSVTYFGPIAAGRYQHVAPIVHVHGWTFFLWYLLLPFQAGLIATRRVAVHRTFGFASLVLASAMTLTGIVVVSHQMALARLPNGSPFWRFLGLSVFATLLLFAVFYALAYRYRRQRELHKRFILLASTGALGAAAFRVLGAVIGFSPTAGVAGVLAPNLIAATAMLVEAARGEGVHRAYRWGLPASLLIEGSAMLLTPTPPGQALAGALGWLGQLLEPIYMLGAR
jgi:hypothetical protein